MLQQFVTFTELFNSHIVETAKMVEYIDTGIQMAIRDEWAVAGMMAG